MILDPLGRLTIGLFLKCMVKWEANGFWCFFLPFFNLFEARVEWISLVNKTEGFDYNISVAVPYPRTLGL